jgi:glycogen operon protein
VSEFAYRFTGSSDLYESNGRTPAASLNFVTCHDGFTLADLVSYNEKHNLANGEDNRDGTDDNRSWNSGAEGPTDDPVILGRRRAQQRNFLVTLFLSQGVPMLLGGDELGRTQQGNNNAYAQDNEISWYDWASADDDLTTFVHRLSRLRRHHPVFRRRRWFQGRPIVGESCDDIDWFTPSGTVMTSEDWSAGYARSLAVFLNGEAIAAPGPRGERVLDDSFYAVFNAYEGDLEFTLPDAVYGDGWVPVIDTAAPTVDLAFPDERRVTLVPLPAGHTFTVAGRSTRLLRRSRADD